MSDQTMDEVYPFGAVLFYKNMVDEVLAVKTAVVKTRQGAINILAGTNYRNTTDDIMLLVFLGATKKTATVYAECPFEGYYAWDSYTGDDGCYLIFLINEADKKHQCCEDERRELAEYERLKAKFEKPSSTKNKK